jgi:hypothetical protein
MYITDLKNAAYTLGSDDQTVTKIRQWGSLTDAKTPTWSAAGTVYFPLSVSTPGGKVWIVRPVF